MFTDLKLQIQEAKRTNSIVHKNSSLKTDATSTVQVNDENLHNTSSVSSTESGKLAAISSAASNVISTRAASKRNVLGDLSNVHSNVATKSTVLDSATSFKPIELLPVKRSFDPVASTNFDAISNAKNSVILPKQISKPAPIPANRHVDKENTDQHLPPANDGQRIGRSLMGPLFDGVKTAQKSAQSGSLLPTAKITTNVSDARSLKEPSVVRTAQAWDDLDAADASDPLMVSEYVVEIIEYMRKLEMQTLPDPKYIESQKELEWSMRSMLMDWVIEIHYKLKLLPETLFIAANIIDRFLSARAVSVTKLQLVGIAGLLIASKYEEVVSPSVSNFAYLSDNAYDEKEILKAERYMLQVLNYNLCYPNPMTFLRRISKADAYDIKTRTLAKYFMEVVLLEESLLTCPPSMMAAASVWISRKMLEKGVWNANLQHYSGYLEAEIMPHAKKIVEFIKKPIKYEALYNKYSSKKFMKASVFAQEYLQNSTKCFI